MDTRKIIQSLMEDGHLPSRELLKGIYDESRIEMEVDGETFDIFIRKR